MAIKKKKKGLLGFKTKRKRKMRLKMMRWNGIKR